MLSYDLRIKTDIPFDYYRIYEPLKNPELNGFSRLIWYGYDEEGAAIYRQNPKTGKVARIDYWAETVKA